ncbi:MAG: TM2 domain-containing protein [Lachnospiraceae bacterium]|nr:TM2 domain-containing protein [Lachnospiraceae bacterium]
MSYCSHCGTQLAENVKFCPNCGSPVIKLTLENEPKYSDPFASKPNDNSFEPEDNGAKEASFESEIKEPTFQRPQEQYTQPVVPVRNKSKVVAGILGILLGGIGIHKFYLGYKKAGLIMLLVTIICAFIGLGFIARIVSIVGLAEGIIYLIKPEDAFYETYVAGTREWF